MTIAVAVLMGLLAVQPTLTVSHKMPAPAWAKLERRLLAEHGPACREFVKKYYDDQGRVQCGEAIEVDVHRPALDEYVGAGGEGVERTGIAHDDRPLAAVERPMGQRAFRIDHVTGERSLVTRALTVGRFDRDHIGAELGQDVPGELTAIIAEIKDSIRREHFSPQST